MMPRQRQKQALRYKKMKGMNMRRELPSKTEDFTLEDVQTFFDGDDFWATLVDQLGAFAPGEFPRPEVLLAYFTSEVETAIAAIKCREFVFKRVSAAYKDTSKKGSNTEVDLYNALIVSVTDTLPNVVLPGVEENVIINSIQDALVAVSENIDTENANQYDKDKRTIRAVCQEIPTMIREFKDLQKLKKL